MQNDWRRERDREREKIDVFSRKGKRWEYHCGNNGEGKGIVI